MSRDEVLRGGTEPIAVGCFSDGSRPPLRECSVELLRAAMDLARTLRSAQEPPPCLLGTMAPMQHHAMRRCCEWLTPPGNSLPDSQA